MDDAGYFDLGVEWRIRVSKRLHMDAEYLV